MPNSIFVDRAVFEESFVPQQIIAREEETKKLISCLKPVRFGDFTVNIYLYGQPGVGKTLVCKTVLEKHFPKKFVYIDCFDDNTKRDIMEQVMALGGIFLHGKISTRNMIKRFRESKKRLVVCLDRCELIKDQEIIEALLLSGCGLILISNQPLSVSKLALKGNSKLYLDEIEFKPYNRNEIFQILKDRARCGLASDVITDDILSLAARICDGDARRGLQLVKLAARDAEILNQSRITVENIESASQKTRSQTISNVLEKLSEKQKIIFDILKENRRMTSGELFRIYRKISGDDANDRSYRNQMNALKEFGLVKEIGVTKGKVYEIT
jgi:Cdc6-like AAA superfamily ATPase